MKHQSILTTFLSLFLLLAAQTTAVAATGFGDVSDTDLFATDIAWLADEGITKGCNPPTNDRFCPDANVTRGQMAAFLVRALPLTALDPAIDFTDDDTSTFENDINILATAGITKGCNPPTNDRFCPDANVTRGQMAAFLVRALPLTALDPAIDFTDDDTSTFENDINILATAGITKGCNPPTNDRFCPDANVTRAQMAAFLHRALGMEPGPVTGLVATLSGGSGEIDVSWTENPEPDIDRYNVWYSELPGGPYELIADPWAGPSIRPPDRIYIIDWPRSLTVGDDCYQVSAVNTLDLEGPRSAEACFTPDPGPPAAVDGVTVGLAGGSEEVDVSWNPNAEGDIVSYKAYFSELPGGPYTFVTTIAPDELNGVGRVHFVDWPRLLEVGKTCYVISAFDSEGLDGPQSAEACFDPSV